MSGSLPNPGSVSPSSRVLTGGGVGDLGPISPLERRRSEERRHRQDVAGGENGAVLPARGARVGLAPSHQPAAMLLLLRRAWRVRPQGGTRAGDRAAGWDRQTPREPALGGRGLSDSPKGGA